MFEISIKTTPETEKLLDSMSSNIKKGLVKGFRKANYFLENKVKSSFTNYLNVRTGNLRRSIYNRIQERGSSISGFIGSNVKYANILHEGGTIKAKNSPYLIFNINGSWIRKKMVEIPSRPYIREPMDKNINEADNIILDEISMEFNK